MTYNQVIKSCIGREDQWIDNAASLIRLTPEQVDSIQEIGPIPIDRIQAFLAEFGLALQVS